MQRKDLEKLSRAELVAKAEEQGVLRPRTLTMPELIDEILLAFERQTGQRRPRGWFGRARDLLTSVIDRGLTADQMRKPPSRTSPAAPPPLPTVTLAEIYAAQGHFERAIMTLDEVIARDPGHTEAEKLRERFAEQLRRTRPSSPPPPDSKAPSIAAYSPAVVASPLPAVDAAVLEAPEELEVRDDVDEVVAIAVDPHTIYAYWEVRPATLASLRASHPDGALVLRVLSVAPQHGAPSSVARDVRVDAVDGDLFVRDLPAASEVRVAIGWAASGGFHPIAVGLDLATPREAPAQNVAVHFGRMSAGGLSEGYDALRAGGLVGRRPAPGTMARPSREEVSLGHAGDGDRSAGDDFGGDVGVEITTIRSGVPLIRTERRIRIGASEQLVTEVEFIGASDRVLERRGGVSSWGGREPRRGAEPDVVSFQPRTPV